mmetsp:Transcript_5758/g.14896  ORF Transcript_5758/g.14896 Transcript_5758/m.14896 type:complete len:298 (+) Transcript_5758:30-923(+)
MEAIRRREPQGRGQSHGLVGIRRCRSPQARRDPRSVSGVVDHLPRCGQRVFRIFRRLRAESAKQMAQTHHRCGERRDERNDGRIDLKRRRYCQSRHRAGVRLYHPAANGRRLPASVGGHRMCRRGSRPRRPRHRRRWNHVSGRCGQSPGGWRRFCHARWLLLRDRRDVRRGQDPSQRHQSQGILRHVVVDGDEQARRRRRRLPLLRRQDRPGPLQRTRRRRRQRPPRRPPLRLHLRRRQIHQGNFQADHLRSLHPADQQRLRYPRPRQQGGTHRLEEEVVVVVCWSNRCRCFFLQNY